MKITLSYSFLLCLIFFASCEKKTTHIGTYKIIWKNSGKAQSNIYSEKHIPSSFYKYKVAAEVFDDLVYAKGNFGMIAPKFFMADSEKCAAVYEPKTRSIILEEKAYDICTTFGKDSLNALACLLAHELTHYYEKHDFSSAFAEKSDLLEKSKKMDRMLRMEEKERKEIEADLLGGMLAFAAGYDPYGMMNQFLRKVYKAYDLDEELAGYPSLEKRIKYAEFAQENLLELIDVFETANYLIALGKYEDAKTYYEYIVGFYNSREIFNNLGVISCLSAMEYFNRKEMPFSLPIELDAQSRLNKNPRGSLSERKEKREVFLKDAIKYFTDASSLDPDYSLAQLNLGCAYILLNDSRQARHFTENVLEMNQKNKINMKVLSDSYVLFGIIAAMNNDTISAQENFDKAYNLGGNISLAKINSDILNGEYRFTSRLKDHSKDLDEEEESIDGIFLSDLISDDIATDIEVQIESEVVLYIKLNENSKVFIHFHREPVALIHRTGSRYKNKSLKGTKVNDDKTALIGLYGVPWREFNLSTGQMLIYPQSNMIFTLGTNGRVKGWCTYHAEDN